MNLSQSTASLLNTAIWDTVARTALPIAVPGFATTFVQLTFGQRKFEIAGRVPRSLAQQRLLGSVTGVATGLSRR